MTNTTQKPKSAAEWADKFSGHMTHVQTVVIIQAAMDQSAKEARQEERKNWEESAEQMLIAVENSKQFCRNAVDICGCVCCGHIRSAIKDLRRALENNNPLHELADLYKESDVDPNVPSGGGSTRAAGGAVLKDIDLRLGDWRDVLADVESVDAVITDPPYLEAYAGGGGLVRECRTKGGYAEGAAIIPYEPATRELLTAIVDRSAKMAGIVILFNDFAGVALARHVSIYLGMTVAEPAVWVKPKSRCPPFGGKLNVEKRCDFIMVASRQGGVHDRRPGMYAGKDGETMLAGGKPLDLMRAIIRDYTKPGDLVCDPCAGGGTTLIAAATEGRRAIGAEIDPETHAKAMLRIKRGYTPSLF